MNESFPYDDVGYRLDQGSWDLIKTELLESMCED